MKSISVSVLLCLSVGTGAFSQTFRGGITGLVTDQSGAVVASSVIKAVSKGTGLSYATMSSTAGEFSFPDLPLGDYTVTISQAGFEALTVKDVHVSAGAIYSLPIKLRVAQTSSTVEVSAAAVEVETTTDAQTTAVSNKTVQDLPINGRNFTQMVAFAPGFAGYGGGGAVNGSRSGQLNQQIEGVDNNDGANNSSAANQGGIQSIPGVIMPLDALEEFSVQSQSGPEVGRDAGATVNLIIKSGTNQLRRVLLQPQRVLRRGLALLGSRIQSQRVPQSTLRIFFRRSHRQGQDFLLRHLRRAEIHHRPGNLFDRAFLRLSGSRQEPAKPVQCPGQSRFAGVAQRAVAGERAERPGLRQQLLRHDSRNRVQPQRPHQTRSQLQ